MRTVKALFATMLSALALASASASASAAEFGLKDLGVSSSSADGSPAVQAGSHPYVLTTDIGVETEEVPLGSGKVAPVEDAKDVRISFPPGFAGNPTAVPRCSAAEFQRPGAAVTPCPDATALGFARIEFGEPGSPKLSPVYNLVPSPGAVAKIGFIVEGIAPVVIDLRLNPEPPYNVIVPTTNIAEGVPFLNASIKIWGVPASHAHDDERGHCLSEKAATCVVSLPEKPFLTLPTNCEEPLNFGFEADSWQNPSPPGAAYPFKTSVAIHDNATPPNALSPAGCAKLEFSPQLTAQPTSSAAESPSGLDVDVDVHDEGIGNPAEGAAAASTIKKTELTLPQGVTINPSQAEGLETCSEAQLHSEGADSEPGEGCPLASKIGTVEVESPLLEGEILSGSLFVATPYQNPAGTLIGLYMVFREPDLGIVIKLPGKVEPDLTTGQLIGTFDDLPQLPFSHFHLHFREGGRSPLVTPPTCGTYTSKATFTPWSNPGSTYSTNTSFHITSGVGGGACPVGVPPFKPGFQAGSVSNAAGSYSPVYMRLTRNDGEQDMTRFSSVFPPGLVGKIAGVGKCSDAAIEAAKTTPGLQEKAQPSCPSSSQIGRVLAGAGVGSELTYVAGQVYLAGPYKGAPLSVAVITPAVAGPFDVGTVVVREGLSLNPITGEVEVDGGASDPIPHILKGIPLKLRDLRVYADRPEFTLNPTNCEEQIFRGTLYGGYADVFSSADDVPTALTDRFQAADCASLGFKPKLSLTLKGGTRRNDHPSLKAVLTPHAGDANIASVSTILPHSEFIDPQRISNPCTRVQFNENACPPTSVLGTAKAWSPLLDEPLEGPVYFRSNGGERKVPDLVADVHGEGFHIIQVGFVDSVKARIRTRFLSFPDAPVSKIVLTLKGGKKGVLVNSANLCAHTRHVKVAMGAQNGRRVDSEPVLKVSCGAKH